MSPCGSCGQSSHRMALITSGCGQACFLHNEPRQPVTLGHPAGRGRAGALNALSSTPKGSGKPLLIVRLSLRSHPGLGVFAGQGARILFDNADLKIMEGMWKQFYKVLPSCSSFSERLLFTSIHNALENNNDNIDILDSVETSGAGGCRLRNLAGEARRRDRRGRGDVGGVPPQLRRAVRAGRSGG